jgi:radical SAM protein with 4Fe4S-binding SPASM domain
VSTEPFKAELEELNIPLYLQPPLPSVFTFEITARCQHRCMGCGNVFSHSNREMDLATWEIILAKIRPHTRALRITGGEPTLHKQFPEFMELIDAQGLPFVLFTNGNWANPNEIIRILAGCTHLKGLLVSLHGSTPAAFYQFTGVDAFERVMKNIRLATSSGIRVATNTLLLASTVNHLPDVAELAFSAGVTNIAFGRYYGMPLEGLSLSPSQIKQALLQIAEMRKKDERVSLSNCVPACFLPDVDFGGGGCTSGITHCTIGPSGDVRPCTHSEEILGYLPDDDIADLWRSAKIMSWRNLIPQDCRTCALLNTCRGGCRAVTQKLASTHDPLCTRALKKTNQNTVIEIGLLDRPKLTCYVESTSFGFALHGTGHYVTLSHQSESILQILDGSTTIEKILDEFGQASLELIGGLLQKQLVELQ